MKGGEYLQGERGEEGRERGRGVKVEARHFGSSRERLRKGAEERENGFPAVTIPIEQTIPYLTITILLLNHYRLITHLLIYDEANVLFDGQSDLCTNL